MRTDERIRAIFLHPKPTYELAECATLLGLSAAELLKAIDGGELAIELRGALPRIPWPELAASAAEVWPQEVIEASLGNELPAAIPELARLSILEIKLPRFNVIALAHRAQRERTTVNALLRRELLGIAEAEVEVLEQLVPGFRAAVNWPAAP